MHGARATLFLGTPVLCAQREWASASGQHSSAGKLEMENKFYNFGGCHEKPNWEFWIEPPHDMSGLTPEIRFVASLWIRSRSDLQVDLQRDLRCQPRQQVGAHFKALNYGAVIHCKWKKMDDMKVMFVFIRVMLADESYVPVNESYHYKMAFGLCAWKQT